MKETIRKYTCDSELKEHDKQECLHGKQCTKNNLKQSAIKNKTIDSKYLELINSKYNQQICDNEDNVREKKHKREHTTTNWNVSLLVNKLTKSFSRDMKNENTLKNHFICFVLLTLTLSIAEDVQAELFYSGKTTCMTGTFQDVQHWAYTNGSLNNALNSSISIDLSNNPSAIDQLRLLMSNSDTWYDIISNDEYDKNNSYEDNFTITENSEHMLTLDSLANVVYLSLARNNLYRIPLYYSSSMGTKKLKFPRLRFLSLYGNNFGFPVDSYHVMNTNYEVTINITNFEEVVTNPLKNNDKSNWVTDLKLIQMKNLLELDLRNCGIEYLENGTFTALRNLRRLYLSHNFIGNVQSDAFKTLSNLIHLDVSYNMNFDKSKFSNNDNLILESDVFKSLGKLKSLDASFTRLSQASATRFFNLPSQLKRLSICYTRFPSITQGLFKSTSIKFLDVSGNIALESLDTGVFKGIENSLMVLNANRLGIKNTTWLEYLTEIRILSLTDNDITKLYKKHFEKLIRLEILDLTNNRISNWNFPIFEFLSSITMVRLGGNNLNLMTDTMMADLEKVRFLGIDNNKFVCNCDLKDFVDKGIENTEIMLDLERDFVLSDFCGDFQYNDNLTYDEITENIYYLDVRRYYEEIIKDRVTMKDITNNITNHVTKPTYRWTKQGNYSTIFLDYLDSKSICIDPRSGLLSVYNNITCDGTQVYQQDMDKSSILIVSMIVVGIVILLAALVFWKWWYIRYFFIMIKNAAILSVMGNSDGSDEEEKVFTYDVFVSYCDDDRKWVLDHLLPEVERTTPINICLHERDFQVGLSILENIISSMDRSRTLMMVVSNQFLLSQWCQFEMHLAQHRLLETRREQLILVLLEDIPRRKRPNTLHYLMMTKTYIVWPANKPQEQKEFWKRLKKALLHGRNIDKSSTA